MRTSERVLVLSTRAIWVCVACFCLGRCSLCLIVIVPVLSDGLERLNVSENDP